MRTSVPMQVHAESLLEIVKASFCQSRPRVDFFLSFRGCTGLCWLVVMVWVIIQDVGRATKLYGKLGFPRRGVLHIQDLSVCFERSTGLGSCLPHGACVRRNRAWRLRSTCRSGLACTRVQVGLGCKGCAGEQPSPKLRKAEICPGQCRAGKPA